MEPRQWELETCQGWLLDKAVLTILFLPKLTSDLFCQDNVPSLLGTISRDFEYPKLTFI